MSDFTYIGGNLSASGRCEDCDREAAKCTCGEREPDDLAVRDTSGDYEQHIADEDYDSDDSPIESTPESCEGWGDPGSDEGFDCCRNQGTAFCDHGPGRQEEGW